MNKHTELGTILLNDQQPISTQNIINMDIIIVKIRDAYELEFIDDPTKTILVEKNLPVSRVIGVNVFYSSPFISHHSLRSHADRYFRYAFPIPEHGKLDWKRGTHGTFITRHPECVCFREYPYSGFTVTKRKSDQLLWRGK